jgi:hypothetical protein
MSLVFERIVKPIVRTSSHVIPDKPYLQLKYKWAFKKRLDLQNPITYNEKLQWLKLYDRDPLYTRLVDKYEVKQYVADKIGEEYIIPTFGVWTTADAIDISSLPDQFVLKGTHDGGSVYLCKDKASFNIENAKKKMAFALKRNYYWHGREWPYKDVQPRIIAEAYMEDEETEELRDYKFFCFDGVVKALFIASDRQKPVDTKFDFFDADGNHLDIKQGHPNADVPPRLPENFELMKELASVLSKGFPQLRVDFYEVNGKVYFGELTFSHFDGMVPFIPEKWDEIFGSYIQLPKRK